MSAQWHIGKTGANRLHNFVGNSAGQGKNQKRQGFNLFTWRGKGRVQLSLRS